MRQALALLAAAALGFVLGTVWQGKSAPPRAERSGESAQVVKAVGRNARSHDAGAPPAVEPPLQTGDEEEDEAPASSTCGVLVDVIGIDGAAPPMARVAIGSRSYEWTPQDRFVAAPPGVHLATARTPADGARSDAVLVTARPNEPASITLRLLPRPSLRVLVVLPPGIAEADVHLYKRPFRGRNIPPLVHPRKLTGQRRYERTWLDLVPGRYLVAAQYRRDPDIDVRQEAVVDGDAQTTVTLELPPPDPACIPVHVLGPDGAPVADAQARAGWRDPANGNMLQKRSVARRDDGALLLPPVPASVPPNRTRLLEVRAPAFGYVLQEFPQGGTVRLQEPGWIELRLDGANGATVKTGLYFDDPDGLFGLDTCRGRAADGRQGFGALQPGRYPLTIFVGARPAWPVAHADMDVASGKTTRRAFTLPSPTHALTVEVASRRTLVLERRLGGVVGRDKRVAYASRPAVFPDLPAGAYVLREKGDETERAIEIPRDKTVHLEH